MTQLTPKSIEVFDTYTHQHSGWMVNLIDERGFQMKHGFGKFPYQNPVFESAEAGMKAWDDAMTVVESVEWVENLQLWEKNVAVALSKVGLQTPNVLESVWESKKPVVEKV